MILAHREIDSNGNILEQALEAHLFATGDRAGELGKSVGLEIFMKLAGYLHDCGKADRCFQDYICDRIKQKVNHSSAGGRILDDFIHSDSELTELQNRKLKFQYFQELLTYIILSHHGLYDRVAYNSMDNNTYNRLCYDDGGEYHYIEDVKPFVQSIDLKLQERGEKSMTVLIKNAYQEFELVYIALTNLSGKNSDIEKRREEKEYYIACLTRLCLSILKEADIYDSANAFLNVKQHIWTTDEQKRIWADASERIEDLYESYARDPNPSEINKARNDLARSIRNAAIKQRNGIFKLELPTGAGKTKAGLRYAVANAKGYDRNRIFYITAYLSVLEQNAADIRSILAMDDIVLEHHSNFTEDDDKWSESKKDIDDYDYRSYLKESWENPVILTTMVQFLNTLFKEKADNIRRFCKLVNSVIIIDEVQSLPLKVISNFNLMMNFMKEIMHCNIVHCTATQPVLDNSAMPYPIHYGNEENAQAEIVVRSLYETDVFRRAEFFNLTGKDAERLLSTEELSEYILNELTFFDSCLVILNTKSAVAKLCDYLEDTVSGMEVIYLTTNLCAVHRLNIISELKNKLIQNRNQSAHHKMICVSTQLIEAGVDVDFDVVFRSIAGIDSIIQCAGRCNREGKLQVQGVKTPGRLFMMRYIEEKLSNLPDIKASADASEFAVRSICGSQIEKDDKIIIESLQIPYFNKYYISNRSKLDYVDLKRQSTMVEELGRNMPVRTSYIIANSEEKRPVMFQAFRTAAENFRLIDEGTTGVIVPYQNEELLEQLEVAINEKNYHEIKTLMQKLQRFSINVYLTPKIEPYVTKNKELNVYILLKEFYNGKRGIDTTELADLIL